MSKHPDPDQSTCDELMTNFYPSRPQSAGAASAADLMRRSPVRISATIPWHLAQQLESRSTNEGRSVSNLVAFLLEQALIA